MLDFQIFRVCVVVNVEELFNLVDTLLGKVDNLVLFINDKVTVFFHFFLHDCLHLSHLALVFAAL